VEARRVQQAGERVHGVKDLEGQRPGDVHDCSSGQAAQADAGVEHRELQAIGAGLRGRLRHQAAEQRREGGEGRSKTQAEQDHRGQDGQRGPGDGEQGLSNGLQQQADAQHQAWADPVHQRPRHRHGGEPDHRRYGQEQARRL